MTLLHEQIQRDSGYVRYEPLRTELLSDPYPNYAKLRQEQPVHRDRRFGWILSRYADVSSAVRDPRLSAQRPLPEEAIPAHLQRVADEVRDVRRMQSLWLLCSDPPQHTRLRGLVEAAFTPRAIDGLRLRIQRTVDQLLDDVAPKRELDLIADLAYPLPATIIADLLGVPIADRTTFKQWSDDIAAASTWMASTLQRAHASQIALVDYLKDLLARRALSPDEDQDDLLSTLLAAQRGGMLTEDELLATCVLLLFAGHETTTNLIGNAVLGLLRHPQELLRLQAEPTLIGSAVEELLRYDSPVQAAFRRALVDITIHGQTIPRGDHVLLLLGAANRDPAQFADPDRLDLGRRPNRHLAFSLGTHYCLGAWLARLEAQIAIQTLFRRFPQLRLGSEETLSWTPNVLFRGLSRLAVVTG
jgi:cytochrome P450